MGGASGLELSLADTLAKEEREVDAVALVLRFEVEGIQLLPRDNITRKKGPKKVIREWLSG